MMNTPTVFILGAGASASYGFPTGDKLKQMILDKTDLNNAENSELPKILGHVGFDHASLNSFRMRLESCGQAIDFFIEQNEKYAPLAKYLITDCLLGCEKESVEPEDEKDHWYEFFWKKWTTRLSGFDKLKDHRLTILTFNYDRSLEEFLITRSKALYPEARKYHNKILEMIKIIHLHGQVGTWVSQSGPGEHSRYGGDVKPLTISKMSSGISFVHEAGSSKAEKIEDTLTQAKQIYFLGFGYHLSNLKKIGIKHLKDTSKYVSGTALGLGAQEIDEIKAITDNNMKLSGAHRVKVLGFMEDYVKFS